MSDIDPFKDFVPRANPKQPAAPLPAIRTDMSKEEWNALADSKLQELLQTTSGALLLAVVRESKDRLQGKPSQAITMDAHLNVVNVNANIEFVHATRDNLIIEQKNESGIDK